MHPILKTLAGGDRRSIGRSNQVVTQVLANPALFRYVFEGITTEDQVLGMRSADAVEKISAKRPALLNPFKRKILAAAASATQKEIRWHLALIIPRLNLTPNEKAAAIEVLFDYLRDKSSIVKAFAMQALADLAATDAKLKSQVRPLLEELTQIGTPAMRARGRKILRQLQP
jgi:hypothetical protein